VACGMRSWTMKLVREDRQRSSPIHLARPTHRKACFPSRDVKFSRPKWSRRQILAPVLASALNNWPRPRTWPHVSSLSLVLGLGSLASFNITVSPQSNACNTPHVTRQAQSTLIMKLVIVVAGLSAMFDIAQGSVTTPMGRGGIFSLNVITNFLLIPTVKKILKSVNI